MLNIYRNENNNPIYGPGKRTVIWFRGCSIRCKNCINPELWNRDSNSNKSIEEVVSKISDDGVTLLGGEPLDQEDIELLIDELKSLNKTIILFTGYSKYSYDDRKKRITDKCDVVISEPFINELKDDSLYLRGSTNQIVTINSNIYKESDFNKDNVMEIEISNNNLKSYGRNKNLINDLLDL